MRIDRFAVPPEEDDAFLAEWDGLAADGRRVLLRAIRADVAARYVELAAGGAGAPYALVREAGDPDGAGGVILIARYQPTKGSDTFVGSWDALRVLLAARRGHLGARLYRGTEDLVEVARWSSPLMLQRAAQDPGVRAAALPGLIDAALYQVVRR